MIVLHAPNNFVFKIVVRALKTNSKPTHTLITHIHYIIVIHLGANFEILNLVSIF